jgi:hypothetical protein
MLYINIICWLFPPFLIKGNIRYFILVLAIIFSGSYWLPIALLEENFNTWSIREVYIQTINAFSVYAAISFYVGLFLILKRKVYSFNAGFLGDFLVKIPIPRTIYWPVTIFTLLALIYSYIDAISQIGIAGRVEFMDEINPLWYSTLLPLLSLTSIYLVFYQFKKPTISLDKSMVFLLLMLLSFNFLVGFDGGRRPIIAPLGMLLVLTIIKSISGDIKPKLSALLIVYFLFSMLFSTILSFNRSFLVGWQIFNIPFDEFMLFSDNLPGMILTPTPTLHVNTQMAQFIAEEGPEGYGSYFRAIGNTLLPKLLLQFYVFGEPLVSELHARFGWYGQDFGFMAEAIFADGLRGVIIIHFLAGLLIALVVRKANKGYLFYNLLLFSICFGFANSLRSDFMNLLKACLYPPAFLYLIMKVGAKFFPNLSTSKRSVAK